MVDTAMVTVATAPLFEVVIDTQTQGPVIEPALINKVEEEALNTMQRLANGVEQCRLAVEKANQEGNQSQQEQAQKDLDECVCAVFCGWRRRQVWSVTDGWGCPLQMISQIAYLESHHYERTAKVNDMNREEVAHFVSRVVYDRVYEMLASFTSETLVECAQLSSEVDAVEKLWAEVRNPMCW